MLRYANRQTGGSRQVRAASRRSFVVSAVGLSVLSALAACGAPPAPTTAPAAPTPAEPGKPAAEAPKPSAPAPAPTGPAAPKPTDAAKPAAEATKPADAAAAGRDPAEVRESRALIPEGRLELERLPGGGSEAQQARRAMGLQRTAGRLQPVRDLVGLGVGQRRRDDQRGAYQGPLGHARDDRGRAVGGRPAQQAQADAPPERPHGDAGRRDRPVHRPQGRS